jgi:hypothetical protein
MGSGVIAPQFLTSALDGSEYPLYPFHRRIGGPEGRLVHCGDVRNLFLLPGIEHDFVLYSDGEASTFCRVYME